MDAISQFGIPCDFCPEPATRWRRGHHLCNTCAGQSNARPSVAVTKDEKRHQAKAAKQAELDELRRQKTLERQMQEHPDVRS